MTLTKALLFSWLPFSNWRWGPALCDCGKVGDRTAGLLLRTLADVSVRMQLKGTPVAGLCHHPHRHRHNDNGSAAIS